MNPPNSLQKFLRDSGVRVVRANPVTKNRAMDPFKTPPASPRRVSRSTPASSPLVLRKRALSLSPRMTPVRRVVPRLAVTPSPPRSKPVARTPTRPKVSASKLTFEPLRVVMATAVSREKRVNKPELDIARLLAKKPHLRREPLVVGGVHYKIETVKINGRDRQNKIVFSRGQKGKSTGTPSLAKTVEYVVHVIAPSGAVTKGSIYVYSSGNVRFSGGVPSNDVSTIAAVHRYIIYTYTRRQRFLYTPLKFSNITGQFRGNFVLNAGAFYRFLHAKKILFRHEPELQQYFFLVQHGDHSFMVRKTGLVQLFKAENPTQLRKAYAAAKELLMSAHEVGMLVTPTGYTDKFHSPAPVKKRPLPVVGSPTVTKSGNGTVCIDGKSCNKLKKAELLAYAAKLNVALPKHVLKPVIIQKIGNAMNPSSTQPKNTLQSIRIELMKKYYDQRLMKNREKMRLFRKRLDEDTRKVKALLNKLPARHRTAGTGDVKKTIRDVVFREIASDTKAYVELSMEIDRVLKEEMTP